MEQVDYLIVGQGLAGSALAISLLKRGQSVVVVDHEYSNSATRQAAGLITTLPGKSMNPTWRQAEYLPKARRYYAALEKRSGERLFYEMPVVRLFTDEKQKQKWFKKLENNLFGAWLSDEEIGEIPYVNDTCGGFTMAQSGRLDTLAYMSVVRDVLGDCYISAEFKEDDVEFYDNGLIWNSYRAKKIILCMGYEGLKNGWFSFLPHRSAKGEMLLLDIPELAQDKMINRNGWIVPLPDGTYKAGATFQWDDLDSGMSEEGRAEVVDKVRSLISCEFNVVGESVGVRPIINRSQPVVGKHPELEHVYVFNGLGSKGVITAPSVAEHFAEHLVYGNDLDPELDITRLLDKKES